MRHKIRKADIRRKRRRKVISDFLRRVMPYRKMTSSTEPEPELGRKELIIPNIEEKTPPPPPSIERDGDP